MMRNHYGDKLHVIFINLLEHFIFVLQVWRSDASMLQRERAVLLRCITKAAVQLISGNDCYRWHYKPTAFICVMTHIKHPTEQATILKRQYHRGAARSVLKATPSSLFPHSSLC